MPELFFRGQWAGLLIAGGVLCGGMFSGAAAGQSTAGELFPGASDHPPARAPADPMGGNQTVAPAPPVPAVPVRRAAAPRAPVPAVAPPAVPETAPSTVPAVEVPVQKSQPPSGAALADATALVVEVYKDDLAGAKTAQQKAALGAKLVRAGSVEKDPANQYALLIKGKDLALEGLDAQTVSAAIEALATHFDFNVLKMEAEDLTALSKSVRTQEQRTQLLAAIKAGVDLAMAAENYDLAERLAEVGITTARDSSDAAAPKAALSLAASVREVEAAKKEISRFLPILAAKPNDPDANLRVGKFRCFYKGDWKAGLPNLALGSDRALAELAKKDLAEPATAEDEMKVGDGWWDAAQAATPFAKNKMLLHASAFYISALPDLTGLSKAKVEKRLEETASLRESEPDAQDGVVAKLLAHIPAQLFPTNDDTANVIRMKNAALHKWITENAPVDRNAGTSVMLTAKFQQFTKFGTMENNGPSTQHLEFFFNDQFDFKGTPCQVHFFSTKIFSGPDDPEENQAKSLKSGASYLISAKITGLSASVGRQVSFVNGHMEETGTPYLEMTFSCRGDFTAQPRAATAHDNP